MQALRVMAEETGLDRHLTLSDSLDLTQPSSTPLDGLVVTQAALLMAQVRARFPHQELQPVTADMYLVEWAETAMKHGINRLAESLRLILRDRERPNFFPSPDEVERVCDRLRREAYRVEQDRLRRKREAEWKAVWERERAEDLAKSREAA